ncbi:MULTISPECIES: transcription elongation factor GreA [Anaerotruncus]|jgi:transcription elongation factor GreA|uniref:Transcription elongation factor GreA n=2 Tax=Anaerotruncus TaxID=244127 RepID=A0A498CTC1_9FIRM|nr:MULTISPECIES: transcription elongation factor GreA [Anaerotruncus]MBC3939428.1 transcription elongation factor GreA [Anaerotruncus massiliensis (ex Togo et al. 2019)]MCQ4896922.1 transcription elongation factor GreA [Anaerotruncus sp. DFI.9.16]RLL09059.1 transcription elongation factor GreA [Anaerotruncus massiliensis (ex Liu et al. 2021)]GKH48000.1 transcription elongation factor GreA [Oscillospiraceae bacterium]
MATEMLMTQEGYEALKKELNELKSVTRGEISEKIRVARGFGDLSENSEYDEAKNEQAVVEARIKKLEDQLKNVKIISRDEISTDAVSVGCKVKILDVDFDEEMEYVIASSVESHSDLDAISDESPVGKGLIGHKVGDVVEIQAPAAVLKLKILEISR